MPENIGVVVSMVGDAVSLIGAVKKAQSTMKEFGEKASESFMQTNHAAVRFQAQIDAANTRVKMASNAQARYSEIINQQQGIIALVQARIKSETDAIAAQQVALDKVNKSRSASQKQKDEEAAKLEAHKASLNALNSIYDKQVQKLATAERGYVKAGLQIEAAGHRVKALKSDLDAITPSKLSFFDKFQKLWPTLQAGFSAASSIFGKITGGKLDTGVSPLLDVQTVGALVAINPALGGVAAAAAPAVNAIQMVNVAVGTLIGNLLTAATQAIPNFIGQMIQLGMQAVPLVAQFEKLSLSMRAMISTELRGKDATLSTAEAMAKATPIAAELQEWIVKLGIKSPFSFEAVQGAFKMAQAMGMSVQMAKRATEAMLNWAAATGREEYDVQRVTYSLSQMLSVGKLSGQEVRELALAGINVWGILSKSLGKTTAEVQKMVESGLLPAEQAIDLILTSLEKDWGGQAEKAAGSFSGLLSSLKDLGTLMLTNFFGPMDEATGKVQGLLGAIQPLLASLVDVLMNPRVQEAIKSIGIQLGEMASAAFEWGQGLIASYADGIIAGIGWVVDALSSVASVVASWLMPGSPPKLLPEIDEWGRGAMMAYLEGMSQVSMGSFNTISSTLEGFLKGVLEGSFDKLSVAPMIANVRTLVAKAVAEIANTGAYSAETFGQLMGSMGGAAPSLKGYTEAMLKLEVANKKVADAQAELNKITKKYDEELSQLSGQLEEISEEETTRQENYQIDVMKARLANTSDEKAKAEIQRAIDALTIQQKIRQTTRLKQTEEDAAKKKLEAAQKEQLAAQELADKQKALLDIQQKNNDLLNEQLNIMKQLADAARAAAGGKGTGGKGGLTDEAKAKQMVDNMSNLLNNIDFGIGPRSKKGKNPIEIFLDKLEELQKRATGFFSTIGTNANKAWSEVKRIYNEVSTYLAPIFGEGGSKVREAWEELVLSFSESWPDIKDALKELSEAFSDVFGDDGQYILQTFGDILVLTFQIVAGIIKGMAKLWRDHHDEIIFFVKAFAFFVGGIFTTLMRGILNTIKIFLYLFSLEWTIKLGQVLQGILDWINNTLNEFAGFLSRAILAFTDEGTKGNFQAAGRDLIGAVTSGIVEAAAGLANAAAQAARDALAAVQGVIGGSTPSTGGPPGKPGKPKKYGKGGFLPAGQLAIVGDEGPELIMSKVDSYIVPNKMVRQASTYFNNNYSSSNSRENNVNVNFGGVNVNSRMDAAMFESSLVKVLRKAIA